MLYIPTFQVFAFCLLCATSEFSDDKTDAAAIKGDLERLQGSWQLVIEVNGQTIRNVKTIEGTEETVRRYDAKTERLLEEHKVEFELTRSGDVKVLTFRSLAEPKGAGLSYVYKVDGKYLFEITGMLTEDRYKNNVSIPRLFRWERLESEKK